MAAHPGFESNVVPFPEPPAKILSADAAGPFTVAVWAAIKVGGNALWRDELVVIDPDAALEDNCLVVALLDRGRPHTMRWWRTGRDHYGRFVPAGDPRECFLVALRISGKRGPRRAPTSGAAITSQIRRLRLNWLLSNSRRQMSGLLHKSL
jgi:hypothetical protein